MGMVEDLYLDPRQREIATRIADAFERNSLSEDLPQIVADAMYTTLESTTVSYSASMEEPGVIWSNGERVQESSAEFFNRVHPIDLYTRPSSSAHPESPGYSTAESYSRYLERQQAEAKRPWWRIW